MLHYATTWNLLQVLSLFYSFEQKYKLVTKKNIFSAIRRSVSHLICLSVHMFKFKINSLTCPSLKYHISTSSHPIQMKNMPNKQNQTNQIMYMRTKFVSSFSVYKITFKYNLKVTKTHSVYAYLEWMSEIYKKLQICTIST